MVNVLKRPLLAAPFALIALYAILIFDEVRFLNWKMEYSGPKTGVAYEDILGFGFYPTFIAFAALVMISSMLVLFLCNASIRYFILVFFLFTLVSIADFVATRAIEKHFISRYAALRIAETCAALSSIISVSDDDQKQIVGRPPILI